MATATKTRPTKKEVVPTKRNLPSTSPAAKYAGKGVSHRQEDNIVPLIYLLQSNSPQTQKGNEKYIKGATGGSIWLRNSPDGENLFDGEEGMTFQPCHFQRSWIEWLPNRGGFVARYSSKPEAAVLKDVEREDGSIGKRWEMPNGNVIQESLEYAGFVLPEKGAPMPYTIPFGGTNITVAKQWMTTMRNTKLEDGETDAALFANSYVIRTKLRQRGKFSWFVYDVSHGESLEFDEDALERGNALCDAFDMGAKQSAAMEADVGDAGAADVDA